jgi:hypothetical protein
MNKPEFGNYNNSLWKKLFKNVECEQIKKYYSNWTSNIDIDKECRQLYVETYMDSIDVYYIAVKTDGTIIISDYADDSINIYKGHEIKEQFYGIKYGLKFNLPSGITIRDNGDIIFADSKNNRICLIKNEVVTVIAGNGYIGYKNANELYPEFNFPNGVAINSNGIIFVTDTGNNCIRAISKEGIVSTIAGSVNKELGNNDGQGTEARFNYPRGIAIMENQTIIIADSGNHRIRSIDIHGMVRTIAGSIKGCADGYGTNSKFNDPFDVAIMKDQTIIVTDNNNHCIRTIDINYNVETIAGSENNEKGDKDGLGTIAKFDHPCGVAILPDNSILVADNNAKIRRLYYK